MSNLTKHGFLREGGEFTCYDPTAPGGAVRGATFTCQHCGTLIRVWPWENLGDKAGNCHLHADAKDPLSGIICPSCTDDLHKTGKCFPWQRMMQSASDREIMVARLRAGVTKY
jgi:hypothetical protein